MLSDQIPIVTNSPAVLEKDESRTDRLYLLLLIIVALGALSVRIDALDYLPESLWAEDGTIFITQSHELGIHSLWVPYTGYLFLYHRVVSLLTTTAPLAATPYFFFFASLLTFVLVAVVLSNRAKDAGLSRLQVAILVCAVALQPSYGESFFNLNHSQYFLGIALAFHVCISSQERASISTILFLTFSSLTGPFSALMIPLLVLQLAILRDFPSRKATYTIVPICGLTQLACMFMSERAHQTSVDRNVEHWMQAISSFFLFGGSNKLADIAAIVFWIVVLIFFLRWLVTQRPAFPLTLWLCPLCAAIAGIILYVSVALASGSTLPTLDPLHFHSRYFLIPYSLTFFVALTCTQNHRAAQTIVISLMSVICAANFLTVDRASRRSHTEPASHVNLQWIAFTKFRAMNPGVAIPVNPLWPIYPPVFKVALKSGTVADDGSPKEIRPILLSPVQSTLLDDAGAPKDLTSTSERNFSATLYFDIQNHCPTSSHLALEVDIWRSRMGWAKIYWGQPGRFDSERSLERFYLEGAAVMQFAFRRDITDSLIRFDPTEGVEPTLLETLNPVRATLAGYGMTLANFTPPGGEVRIETVRLFCLE